MGEAEKQARGEKQEGRGGCKKKRKVGLGVGGDGNAVAPKKGGLKGLRQGVNEACGTRRKTGKRDDLCFLSQNER